MKTNLILFAIIALLTYGATIYLDNQKPPVIAQPEIPDQVLDGETVPEFSFITPNGKAHKITDFKGKIILLNFWASWCPPCVKEFPTLLELAANNQENVVLIALSSDLDEPAMNVFLKKQSKPAKNVFIALDTDQSITQELFQTYKLPETILIDRAQNMFAKILGADWEISDMQDKIDALSQNVP